jgi:hypothetical protein
MSARFNPPPNWPPAPDGWTPPQGWQPDPAWGPAPDGWQLWLDNDTAAAPAASGKKQVSWFRRHKILTGLAAFIVLVGAGSALGGGGDDRTPSKLAQAASAPTTSTTSSTPAAVETTAAETPAPSAEPADEPQPKAVTYTGRGDKLLKIKKPEEGAVPVTITYTGGYSNFVVEALDSSNESTDLLVNEIGSFKGTVLLDADGGETAKLKIQASGKWKVVIKPLSATRQISTAATGKGPDVLLYAGDDAATLTFTNKGDANVVVQWMTEDGGDLLVNDIGNYKGELALTPGPGILTIDGGSWTAKVVPD